MNENEHEHDLPQLPAIPEIREKQSEDQPKGDEQSKIDYHILACGGLIVLNVTSSAAKDDLCKV